MPRAPHPLLIIGLDGATWDLLDPFAARGWLPNLARLMSGGLRTELRSTLPPVTFPAWTSFLTAADPGQHGVTDILSRRGYGLVPANASLRTQPTFLRRLSERGLRVASLGVPGTYPPEPVHGICVAGFDAPDARRAGPGSVWPPELWPELTALGGWRYATFNEFARVPDRLGRAVEGLLTDLDQKQRVILELYRSRTWDLFFVHLQASDTAGHHLWHTFDRGSPRFVGLGGGGAAEGLPRIYRRLDRLIGALLAVAPDHGRTLVVSDHGMGGASTTAVHLNRVLHGLGLLTFARTRRAREASSGLARAVLGRLGPGVAGHALRLLPRWAGAAVLAAARGVAVDFSRSLAFSDELDYGPTIWLNRVGVFPRGQVSTGQAVALLERIRAALLELRDPETGDRLIRAVHRREQAFAGPWAERGADLVIEPAWPGGYRPSFLPSAGPGPEVRKLSAEEHGAAKGAGMPGVHRREGIFIAHGPGLRATEIPMLRLAEAGALVEALMGLPVSADLAVQPPSFCAELFEVRAGDATTAASGASTDRTFRPDEIVAIEARLRSLGYLG